MQRGDIARSLGRRLKTLRISKGMTAEKVAWEADITPAYMSMVEKGKNIPSIVVLARIANALGVKVADLLNFGI